MKITLLTGEYPPMRGGVADYSALLADGLTRLGVEVCVLTSSRAKTARSTEVPIEPSVTNWGSTMWSQVARQTGRHRPDLIHVQYQTGAFDLQLGVNALPWINRFRGGQPPLIVTFHDLREPYVLPKIGPARHLATVALAAGADAVVITNSEDLKRVAGPSVERASIGWGRRPVRAIPIGSNIPSVGPDYDRSHWRERIGARDDEFLIGYFGFLGPAKGIDTLATAFEMLVKRRQSVRLLMIGAASGDSNRQDRQFESGIRRLLDLPGIRGRVTWTGYLASESVGAYLSAVDACCLPFREGTSLRHGTLIAAIVQGVAIITTTSSERHPEDPLPRLVSERNALLVPPDDPVALVGAVERLVANPSLRRTIADGARELSREFQWDAIARATLDLYHEVTARRSWAQ